MTADRPITSSSRRHPVRFAALSLAILPLAAAAPSATPPPAFANGTFAIDGAPALILGGELANSSASSRAYMAPRWAKLAAMHLDTVLMPVSWELAEPREGAFDFALVDGLLADARAAGLRVGLLWFGTWKNSQSSYVPGWVKRDQGRFPRARDADGRALEMLSPFAPANAAADARAFAALMAHLAQADPRHTVVLAQVENEVGMIPDTRDHSAAAEEAWAAPVPAGLPGAGGAWGASGIVDGVGPEERFSAWGFARYTGQVAAAGRRAYPLPLYANAALPRPGARPGAGYPAAGPIPALARVWHAGAPALDWLSPDIYFPNFTQWARAYRDAGEPLFVPEAGHAGDAGFPANALFAIGELGGFGVSPFAIDEIDDASAKDVAALYAMLAELKPAILAHRAAGEHAGVRAPVAFDGTADLADQTRVLAGQRLTFRLIDPWTPRDKQHPETHGAIAIALAADELLVAGRGVTVTFAPADGRGSSGIEWIEEGHYAAGRWVPGRRLNGDENHQGRHLRLPPDAWSIQRVRLYRYG